MHRGTQPCVCAGSLHQAYDCGRRAVGMPTRPLHHRLRPSTPLAPCLPQATITLNSHNPWSLTAWCGHCAPSLNACPFSPSLPQVDAIGGARHDDGAGGDNEVQRTMLEIVNQLDGFDSRGNIKVRWCMSVLQGLQPCSCVLLGCVRAGRTPCLPVPSTFQDDRGPLSPRFPSLPAPRPSRC